MRLNKKQFNRWLTALYNEEFPQGQASLQSKDGYCCLGVACEVLISKNKQSNSSENRLQGDFPEDQTYSPKWLQKINNNFSLKTGKSLSILNDVGYFTNGLEPFTHPEIAMLLDLVYNYKILD